MYRCKVETPEHVVQLQDSESKISKLEKTMIAMPLSIIIFELALSYFVFIIGLCIFQLILRCSDGFHGCNNNRSTLQIIFHLIHGISYLILYNTLLLLFLISYIKAISYKAGNIPLSFFEEHPPDEFEENIENQKKNSKNSITFCPKCKQYRPPRAHHCKFTSNSKS